MPRQCFTTVHRIRLALTFPLTPHPQYLYLNLSLCDYNLFHLFFSLCHTIFNLNLLPITVSEHTKSLKFQGPFIFHTVIKLTFTRIHTHLQKHSLPYPTFLHFMVLEQHQPLQHPHSNTFAFIYFNTTSNSHGEWLILVSIPNYLLLHTLSRYSKIFQMHKEVYHLHHIFSRSKKAKYNPLTIPLSHLLYRCLIANIWSPPPC